MQQLTGKKLHNLQVRQLDEIRRELGTAIGTLRAGISKDITSSGYQKMRNLEKYLITVKAVLQHKRNTNQE